MVPGVDGGACGQGAVPSQVELGKPAGFLDTEWGASS